MYYDKLSDEVSIYIQNELRGSTFYLELARSAPTDNAWRILREFGNDEKVHAEQFIQAYYSLTSRIYIPEIPIVPEIPDYQEALKKRMLVEITDYREYGDRYIEAPNKYLKDLFFMVKMAEARHAMRMPVLLQDFYI